MLPSVLLRQPDNRHRLVIQPEFVLNNNTDREKQIQDNIQRFMDIIAIIYTRHPDLVDWMSLTVRLDESHQARDDISVRANLEI